MHVSPCVFTGMMGSGGFQGQNLLLLTDAFITRPRWGLLGSWAITLLPRCGMVSKDGASDTGSCCEGAEKGCRNFCPSYSSSLPLLSDSLPGNPFSRAEIGKWGTRRRPPVAVLSEYLGLGRKSLEFQSGLSPGRRSKRRQGAWDEEGNVVPSC